MRNSLRLLAVWTVVMALGFHPTAVLASADTARLDGRIVAGDGESPLVDVEVVAYNLATESLYRSQPTDEAGRYRVEDLPAGYYDVAVETEGGLFLADRPVRVAQGGVASVSLSIGEPGAGKAAPLPKSGKVDSVTWASLTGALGGPVVGTAVVVGGLALSAVVVGSALDDDSNGTNCYGQPSCYTPTN